jgi:hypothetical protein
MKGRCHGLPFAVGHEILIPFLMKTSILLRRIILVFGGGADRVLVGQGYRGLAFDRFGDLESLFYFFPLQRSPSFL